MLFSASYGFCFPLSPPSFGLKDIVSTLDPQCARAAELHTEWIALAEVADLGITLIGIDGRNRPGAGLNTDITGGTILVINGDDPRGLIL